MSLQLNLDNTNQVTVTNLITQEKKTVALTYIQKITRNSLDILIQYKAYEIIIDAQSVWNQIKYYDSQWEAAKEIEVEKKFRAIMTPGSWIEITDYEREQHEKALRLTEIYNPHTGAAKTSKVIERLKVFNWEIVDIDNNCITLYNHTRWLTDKTYETA